MDSQNYNERTLSGKSADEIQKIVVSDRQLRDVSAEVLEALYEANVPPQIFCRTEQLVRIANDVHGHPYIQTINESAMRGIATRTCNFIRYSGDKEINVSPMLDLIRDILSLPHWKFPSLLDIVAAPVIRPDGSLLIKPGYDPVTRLYYRPSNNLSISTISKKPSSVEVSAAKNIILEPFIDFPFKTEADRANAIATLLSLIFRPMILSPLPLSIFDKPQAGTGASLLAEVISIIVTGRPAAIMTARGNDEEWRKTITSLLLEGARVVVIDNIEGKLSAPSLAAVLTSTNYKDRLLSMSKMVTIPNLAGWIATGNNIVLGGDLVRRCIRVSMDSQMARPWTRNPNDYRHPHLTEWVLQIRGAILGAILTIAKAWGLAGMPKAPALPNLGSYESYCQIIGGVLAYMGIDGFLGNLETMYAESDTETPQWEGFLEALYEIIGEIPISAAGLTKQIRESQELRSALPDAISDVESKNYTTRLGQQLAKRKNVRYPNGCTLVISGKVKRAATWRVSLGNETSPNVSLKSEVGEVANTITCGEIENSTGDGITGGKSNEAEVVETSSPNLTLATKYGEVDLDEEDDEIHNYDELHELLCSFGLLLVDIMEKGEGFFDKPNSSMEVLRISSDTRFRGTCQRCGVSFPSRTNGLEDIGFESCPSCGHDEVTWAVTKGEREIIEPRELASRIYRALGLDDEDD